jgi:hypothetical protein
MQTPEWISGNTLIDTINHPVKTVWLEEHRNLVDDQRVFLFCELGAVPKAYPSFDEAFNAIGAKYGFIGQWKKTE